jgi:hypothetical protein
MSAELPGRQPDSVLRGEWAAYLDTLLGAAGLALGAADLVTGGVSPTGAVSMAISAAQMPSSMAESVHRIRERIDAPEQERLAALQRRAAELGVRELLDRQLEEVLPAHRPATLAGMADGAAFRLLGSSWSSDDAVYTAAWTTATALGVVLNQAHLAGIRLSYAEEAARLRMRLAGSTKKPEWSPPPTAVGSTLDELAPLYEAVHRQYTRAGVRAAVRNGLPGPLGETVRGQAAWISLHEALADARGTGLHGEALLTTVHAQAALTPGMEAAELAQRVRTVVDRHRRSAGTFDGELPEWLPRPPASDDTRLATVLRRLAGTIATRVEELAEHVRRRPPHWLPLAGACPPLGEERAEWLRVAGRLAAYREQFRVAGGDVTRPLGDPPAAAGHARQQRAFALAVQLVPSGGDATLHAGAGVRVAADPRAAAGRTPR